MNQNDVMLLDCTLRDGGYVNGWEWGGQTAKDIIACLIKAKVDVVEVGFLRDIPHFEQNVTVANKIEELNLFLPESTENTMFSAMAMQSNYDISKLSPYSGSGIEMIRVTAHDYDLNEGMAFAKEVKEKGYKLSINPINIMGYSDSEIMSIVDQVNHIQPYQFSIVDTFGSMRRRDLDRIVSLVDNNLDKNIRLALHLHENLSLSCCLAQSFIDKHLNRPVAIDASLMGMGRIPGNLPIELIADYLNEYTNNSYNIDFLMDAIQDHIAILRGTANWGYTPAYFLSARFNLHRNYAEHYIGKGDLTNKDINHILSRIDNEKKTVFDSAYADALYEEYKDHRVDDNYDRVRLSSLLKNKNVLIVAPGSSIVTYEERIKRYAESERPVVFSLNFIPRNIPVDFAFFSNSKRYNKIERFSCKTIVTSNIKNANADYVIDYNSVTGAFDQGLNSLIMLLKLLMDMDVKKIAAAGADGYRKNVQNYYDASLRSYTNHDNRFNLAVIDAIHRLGAQVNFITPSEYRTL